MSDTRYDVPSAPFRYILALIVIVLALLLILGLIPFNGTIVGGMILLAMAVAFF